MREATSSAGLVLLDAPTVSVDPIIRLRSLTKEGLVSIYCSDPDLKDRLAKQIDSVQLVPTSTGLRVVHSREDGAHGDMVAALALCTWQQAGALAPVKPPPETEKALYAKRIAREGKKDKRGRGKGTDRSFRGGFTPGQHS